jgi:metal transporter CNNM
VAIVELLIIILEVVALVGIAALCSGLNVAFMSLNLADLRRKAKLGSTYAKWLLPLRKNAHLTLAAILLTNVAAASITPLVIDSRLSGVWAVVITTLSLTIFAEIMPQALFAQNALLWTGRLVWLLRLMIIITYPIAKPIQLMLDRMFKKATHSLHTRHELGLLVAEHLGSKDSELDEDEVEIIKGALQLSEKKVGTIMTPIEKVYSLSPFTLIDDRLIDEIKATGHSRIPVFNSQKTICFGVILVKELVDIDFDEHPPRVDELVLHPTQLVGAGTALDTMFRKFISAQTHLIPVEKDDVIVGIVTIEDLLEEILGHEIEDESDRTVALARSARKTRS